MNASIDSDAVPAGRIPDFSDDYRFETENKKVLTAKEMDADDQPREKAKRYGIEALSNADLMALILRTGIHGYPITELCRDLMRRNENLICNLERATVDQLMEIRGVGELKAYQIMAVMEIVRRYGREKVGERFQVRSSADIHALMKAEIGNAPYEQIWVIFLNRNNRVIGKMRVSEGSAVGSVFDIKKILRQALHVHAEGLVLSHNHPSGNLQPSGPDDNITRKMKEGCNSLDLTFLDHVIVTFDGHYSYRDNGRL